MRASTALAALAVAAVAGRKLVQVYRYETHLDAIRISNDEWRAYRRALYAWQNHGGPPPVSPGSGGGR